MPEAWEKLDLHGAGLQSLQIRLKKLQKKPLWTYLSWLGFPLGLHRFYLHRRRAWIFPAASIAVLALTLLASWYLAALAAVVLAALALHDLRHLSAWLGDYNKEMRKQAWFAQNAPAAPQNYRGRADTVEDAPDYRTELEGYRRIKESERGGHPAGDTKPERKGFGPGQRRLSFAEQEKLLAELSKKKGGEGPDASA
ncbi:TM2 domain-containing protein [Acidithiobacillus caldus]|uniref:TM2 domain-containing protein n=1 Tax=Acidithiobacillus caldus TaxID=33059 RepID=A0A1E7YUM4_9PROT|nr:hypothetical protein BAE30_09105 [Acidithiobacillus caldus]